MRRVAILLVVAGCRSGGADGSNAALEVPLYELRQEWRINSNDSSRLTRFSNLSDASPVLSGDRLMLIDAGEVLIRIYDSDGKVLKSFGRRGTGPLEFSMPAVGGYLGNNDTVWISDFMRRRYQLMDSSFAPIGSAMLPTLGGQYLGIFAGNVIAVNSKDTLRLFDFSNKVQTKVHVPFHVDGFTVVAMAEGRERTYLSPFAPRSEVARIGGGKGMILVEPAEFWDGKPGELSLRWIETPSGTLSDRTIVKLPPRRITRAYADSAIEQALTVYRITDASVADNYRANAKIPDYAPSFSSVALVNEDQVWLRIAESDSTIVVVSRAGKPVMRVRVPDNISLLGLSGDYIWALVPDSNQLSSLARYRVHPVERK